MRFGLEIWAPTSAAERTAFAALEQVLADAMHAVLGLRSGPGNGYIRAVSSARSCALTLQSRPCAVSLPSYACASGAALIWRSHARRRAACPPAWRCLRCARSGPLRVTCPGCRTRPCCSSPTASCLWRMRTRADIRRLPTPTLLPRRCTAPPSARMRTMVTLPDSLVVGARAVDNHKRRRPCLTALAMSSSTLQAGQTVGFDLPGTCRSQPFLRCR
jgi:hypothetical protein